MVRQIDDPKESAKRCLTTTSMNQHKYLQQNTCVIALRIPNQTTAKNIQTQTETSNKYISYGLCTNIAYETSSNYAISDDRPTDL